jgi:DNA-binding transcriptional MerR regulator
VNRPDFPDTAGPPPAGPEPEGGYTIELCARITGLSRETVVHYREQGFIRPLSAAADTVRFGDEALRTLRRIEHLRETYGVNDSGLRLILALLEEVESLRDSLQARR